MLRSLARYCSAAAAALLICGGASAGEYRTDFERRNLDQIATFVLPGAGNRPRFIGGAAYAQEDPLLARSGTVAWTLRPAGDSPAGRSIGIARAMLGAPAIRVQAFVRTSDASTVARLQALSSSGAVLAEAVAGVERFVELAYAAAPGGAPVTQLRFLHQGGTGLAVLDDLSFSTLLPEARRDRFTVQRDSPRRGLAVLRNDDDAGSPARITAISVTSLGGIARLLRNGRIAYTPAPGAIGVETFSYTLTNEAGSDSAMVTVRLDPPTVSLRQVQSRILQGCSDCHSGPTGPGIPRGMNLSSAEDSFQNLVNVPSRQVPALMRIAPGDPDNSYLVQKVEGTNAVGARMPLGNQVLSAQDLADLRRWVLDGALNN